ncbi:MAG: hypothetical protein KDH88_07580 [Chromatiales bacterium]|nr:hypothetical protein [Chromatiales bacterium]
MSYRSYAFLFSVVMLILVTITLWVNGKIRIDDHLASQRQIMRTLADSVAAETGARVINLERRLRLFAADNEHLLEDLARNPENDSARAKVLRLIADHFPEHYAFTIANQRGVPLLDDFDDSVSDLCQKDIARFADDLRHANQAVIHPQPFHYHFDIMTAWGSESYRGVFFLSFRPELISNLLAHREIPNFRLLLLNGDDPYLIEITAKGARDRLGEKIRLNQEEFDRIEFSPNVPNTRWRLAVIPSPNLYSDFREDVILQSVFVIVVYLVIAGVMMTLVSRQERERELAEEELQNAYRRLEQRMTEHPM